MRAAQFLFALMLYLESVHHVPLAARLVLVSGRASLPLTACLAASVQLPVKAQGMNLLCFMLE